mgnify:FL=1
MKIIKDSNDQYHSHDSISASGLKTIYKKSVYHLINQKFKETPAMALGTAVHQAILEPDDFYDMYHVIEKINKRTKVGKEEYQKQLELADNKIILETDTHEIIKNILGAFRQNELAQKYCKGEIELSHYTQYEGIDVRVRPDCINRISNFISDVKTCQDNSPEAFKRDIYKWGYHLQAAFYMDMCGIDTFKFIAVTTTFPHTVEVYTLSDEMIEFGRNAYKQAFSKWKQYLETGVMPSYHWYQFSKDGSYVL